MTAPRSRYVPAAGYEIHVTEWGVPGRPALVMWHGLVRTGRDFDEAAAALADEYFVLCPDTIGRGLSSWAKPEDYNFAVYHAVVLELLGHYGIDSLRWVGTSMGGLIGATLAAGVLRGRISHLVMNDIGPDVAEAGARRIADYLRHPPSFATVTEFEAFYRRVYAPFGDNTDAFWQRLTESSVRRTDDGRLTVHYDPGIAMLFGAYDLWPEYNAVAAKALLLRGSQSDVLSRETARHMQATGPRPELIELEGVGHAPTLTTAREIGLLRSFMAR
jgi:pimeloyl-ACP methyl ester carboxylesterase